MHLIDDPPEQQGAGDETEASDGREPDGEAGLAQPADEPVRDGDEAEMDVAEPDRAARLRGAMDSTAGALRSSVAGIGKAAGAVGDRMVSSARSVGGRVSEGSARAGRLASNSLGRVPVRRLAEPLDVKGGGPRQRGTRDQCRNEAGSVDADSVRFWCRNALRQGAGSLLQTPRGNTAATTAYSTAATTWSGPGRTSRGHSPKRGGFSGPRGTSRHYGRTWATPRGIPVVTWDKEAFDAVARFLNETLGISRDWVKDMATFTATEFVGAVLAALALALSWNKAELRRFSEVVASLGLSALVGASPILVLVTIIGLAKCFHEARHGRGIQARPERGRPGNGRNDGAARCLAPDARTRVGDFDAGCRKLSRGNQTLRQGGAQGRGSNPNRPRLVRIAGMDEFLLRSCPQYVPAGKSRSRDRWRIGAGTGRGEHGVGVVPRECRGDREGVVGRVSEHDQGGTARRCLRGGRPEAD